MMEESGLGPRVVSTRLRWLGIHESCPSHETTLLHPPSTYTSTSTLYLVPGRTTSTPCTAYCIGSSAYFAGMPRAPCSSTYSEYILPTLYHRSLIILYECQVPGSIIDHSSLCHSSAFGCPVTQANLGEIEYISINTYMDINAIH